ncbi:MAG: hypothetical protein Ct9H300mP4_03180 [Gammaproteobacteria bacterium]|mgnify:CR=1 FL=1|jgi:hypothetical protein|nr:MAG: hypothetical protein Ct9H300mP4_03180 [Gammaproteobacteria bacterium]
MRCLEKFKEPTIPQFFMYDDLAKLLQKGLAKEGRSSERLSIILKTKLFIRDS